MTPDPVDLERIRDVLRRAIKPSGKMSGRGLAREAGLNRDAVYDILKGRNVNPSVRSLAALAQAMGKDLSIFGMSLRTRPPNAAELEQALLEALPEMPRRGSWDRKASFLAAAVAGALRLPPAPPATPPGTDRRRRRSGSTAAAPPVPTS
jgi:transcriptional regulator with XRE-family HTH domain